jgi:hypothetical protein
MHRAFRIDDYFQLSDEHLVRADFDRSFRPKFHSFTVPHVSLSVYGGRKQQFSDRLTVWARPAWTTGIKGVQIQNKVVLEEAFIDAGLCCKPVAIPQGPHPQKQTLAIN